MREFAPPPTRYSSPSAAQGKPAATPAGRLAHPPPPTRYAVAATAQAKPGAVPRAPVNGPAPGPAHVPPPTRFGPAAAQPKPAAAPPRVIHPPPPNPDAAGTIQPYQVLGPGKLFGAMPARRPWFNYPYAVVAGAQLPAQERRVGIAGEDAFLAAGNPNAAHVQGHGGGMSLRVSDTCQMAIEDSDLGQRQPKTFYLAAALLATSNLALQNANSGIQLAPTGQNITILTGWQGQQILQGVTVTYLNHLSPDQLPQNCNDIAGRISGNAFTTHAGGDQTLRAREQLSGAADGQMSVSQVRSYVRKHGNAGTRWNRTLANAHLNQFANPGIGESYMISTTDTFGRRDMIQQELAELEAKRQDEGLTWRERLHAYWLQREFNNSPAPAVGPHGGTFVMDYQSGQNRELNWTYHFAGVVAQSGSDVVTVENYARGDNRQANPDPRWYFQMYGQAKSGQSFHEAHKAQQAYSNPITVAVRR